MFEAGVATIGEFMFYQCANLTTVVLPDSVTYVDYAAFSGCDNLWHVLYQGTEVQWNAMILNGDRKLKEAVRHYNCTGDEVTEVLESLPTCTEGGAFTHRCSICGESQTNSIEALGHSYAGVVTAPTCTEGGYTTFTCKLCGESYVDAYTEPTGHRFGDWFVTVPATCTEDGEETRRCVNCDHAESRVIPAFCPSGVYSDVPMNIWYHEAVDFVTKCGIMEGVGDGKFWPDGVTTRGQLVTVLYRMAGMPAVEDECGFTDVPADSWYHDAVVWAYVSGITTGMTDTLFAPSSHVTREQVVTFLCRYAGFTGMDTTATGDLSAYADADLVSDYALPAMTWAVEQGIITGMTDDTLSPGASSTRAQIATMLMRFLTIGEYAKA